MSEFCKVMVLAVLQGVAEFLPISSSGHLVIAQSLLDVNKPGMELEVILHVGTMFSILIFYRKFLVDLALGCLRREKKSLLYLGYVILSAIPAVVFYLLCHKRIEAFYESPRSVGGFLMFTGLVLLLLRWLGKGNLPITGGRAFLVGIAQALAILPGISRSGMTIASARMAGIAADVAAEFSFVMVLPLLAGGALLDILKMLKATEPAADAHPGWLLGVGALVSAVVGYFALALLVKVLKGGRFWYFGVYCLLAGLFVICCLK